MEKEQFVREVREVEKTMYRIAKTYLQEEKDCEDAVQEAILHAYEKLDTLREERFFKTWLVRILINECHQLGRGKSKLMPLREYMQGNDLDENGYYENRLEQKRKLENMTYDGHFRV